MDLFRTVDGKLLIENTIVDSNYFIIKFDYSLTGRQFIHYLLFRCSLLTASSVPVLEQKINICFNTVSIQALKKMTINSSETVK